MRVINKVCYLFKEGLVSIFSHGFMSFASVTIIMACLIIMGSFSLIAVNIDTLITRYEDDNEILAYVDDKLSDADAKKLEADIKQIEHVAQVQFVSRDEAMDSFAKDYENQLFEDINSEVLRHRYIVYMDEIEFMPQIQRSLLNTEGIAKVNASPEIAQGFITVRNIISAVSLVIIIILVIVSIFIMSNTIKLTTFGRREEIAIMKMVGATNNFIRWPFVVEGIILGTLGAGIAFVLQWGLYLLVSDKVMTSVVGKFVPVVPFNSVMYPILWVFMGVGALVGTFGGVIAIRNYLKV